MKLDRFDWLAKRSEDAIDPERPIVDPHHHLWDRPDSRYLSADLLADTGAAHNVVKTVFVECHAGYRDDGPPELRPVGETEFVVAQAEAATRLGGSVIAGIVSHADMMLGAAVEPVLEAHEAAGAGLFRGVRHATSWVDDPGVREGHHRPAPQMMATAEFRAGVATLGRLGHSFDAWLLHPQIPELTDLARAAPETTIIIDHLGGPLGTGSFAGRRDEIRPGWEAAMRELATCPNVVVKLGGIGMEMYFGMGWHELDAPPASEEVARYWGDWINHCIDVFGPARCMFESNFPVDRSSLPYPVLWNSFQIIGAAYDESEQHELFAGTATRTYRLD